ncbi:MAG: DUF362 domain-containing protein [Deltaproteobacteria bacterium]|nr:DUF362 domain-containing protein [Candidatus Zymogenaceae bacterium]
MREIEVGMVKIPEQERDNEALLKTKLSELIEISGGLDFIQPKESVLIKIAMNSPRPYPATVDPMVVSYLLDAVVSKKPSSVYIADKSNLYRNTKKVFDKTGLTPVVKKASLFHVTTRIKLLDFDDFVYRDRYLPDDFKENWEINPGRHFIRAPKMLFEDDPFLKNMNLAPKVDHIIVLGTVRTHVLSRFALGMNSYTGFLDTESRCLLYKKPYKKNLRLKSISPVNKENIQRRIPELFTVIPHPKLIILDGRESMITGGPDSNGPIQLLPSIKKNPYTGIMIAGRDIVATDAAGVALLKSHRRAASSIRNTPIWEMPTFIRAEELGLGATREDKIILHADIEDDLFTQMAWFLQ